jgi:hypothetical protein
MNAILRSKVFLLLIQFSELNSNGRSPNYSEYTFTEEPMPTGPPAPSDMLICSLSLHPWPIRPQSRNQPERHVAGVGRSCSSPIRRHGRAVPPAAYTSRAARSTAPGQCTLWSRRAAQGATSAATSAAWPCYCELVALLHGAHAAFAHQPLPSACHRGHFMYVDVPSRPYRKDVTTQGFFLG